MKDVRVLSRFQQSRSHIPANAEKLTMSEFCRSAKRPSVYAKGHDIRTEQFHCPSCEKPMNIEHGDRLQCGCGLFMENYGNSLVIWREDPE